MILLPFWTFISRAMWRLGSVIITRVGLPFTYTHKQMLGYLRERRNTYNAQRKILLDRQKPRMIPGPAYHLLRSLLPILEQFATNLICYILFSNILLLRILKKFSVKLVLPSPLDLSANEKWESGKRLMKTTIFGLALIGQQLHCSAPVLSVWLICRGLSGPFSLKICPIQRTDWDFLKLETLKKNSLSVCWVLDNPFSTTWPQKVEYVLSYAGNCFLPEACFYRLFFLLVYED